MSLLVYYAAQAGGQLAGPHIVPVPLGLSESITAIFQSSNLMSTKYRDQKKSSHSPGADTLKGKPGRRMFCSRDGSAPGSGPPGWDDPKMWTFMVLRWLGSLHEEGFFWGSEEMASSRFMTRWVLYAIHFAFRNAMHDLNIA